MLAELFSSSHPAQGFVDLRDGDERSTTQLSDVKSSPPLSLFASLWMYMLNVESLAGIALVWSEFVKELRFRWDRFEELPRTGVPGSDPQRFCRLFQRLQMLNWCIQQRRLRNETAKKAALGGWSTEEFDNVSSGDEQDDGKQQAKATIETAKGEGVKNVLQMSLLLFPERKMCEPETQDAGIAATEDMQDEREQLLLALGEGEKAAEMRRQIQEGSLLSDMESFKAANPGCVLADFVRWHSPKDWIVLEDSKEKADQQSVFVYEEAGVKKIGKLSSRMVKKKKEKIMELSVFFFDVFFHLFQDGCEPERVAPTLGECDCSKCGKAKAFDRPCQGRRACTECFGAHSAFTAPSSGNADCTLGCSPLVCSVSLCIAPTSLPTIGPSGSCTTRRGINSKLARGLWTGRFGRECC